MLHSFWSQFGARAGFWAEGQTGGVKRQAQAHEVTISDEDMARTLGRATDGDNGETPAVKRMSGVGDLDFLRRRWVLERGIVLLGRSTRWIMPCCGNCCNGEYATGCCCV
jgi:hypothetical protein